MSSSDGKTEKSGGRLMYIETSSSRSDSVRLIVMRKSIRTAGSGTRSTVRMPRMPPPSAKSV